MYKISLPKGRVNHNQIHFFLRFNNVFIWAPNFWIHAFCRIPGKATSFKVGIGKDYYVPRQRDWFYRGQTCHKTGIQRDNRHPKPRSTRFKNISLYRCCELSRLKVGDENPCNPCEKFLGSTHLSTIMVDNSGLHSPLIRFAQPLLYVAEYWPRTVNSINRGLD